VISSSDPKVICSKAIEVMSFVDQELGFNTQTSILPSTKKVGFCDNNINLLLKNINLLILGLFVYKRKTSDWMSSCGVNILGLS
jgi:hypothetical protein